MIVDMMSVVSAPSGAGGQGQWTRLAVDGFAVLSAGDPVRGSSDTQRQSVTVGPAGPVEVFNITCLLVHPADTPEGVSDMVTGCSHGEGAERPRCPGWAGSEQGNASRITCRVYRSRP